MAQKSVLQITQAVAAELNLPVPAAVFGVTEKNVIKLLSLVTATCDDLLREFDWQSLIKRYSFSTVAGQEAYSLPPDLDRFISQTFFDTNNRWPLRGPKTPAEWEWLKSGLYQGAPFTRFRIFGNQFYITPVPDNTAYTFNMEYVSSYYVKDGTDGLQTPKATFTQDSDICVFDHRVVVYGTKLKLKESLGQDTSAALVDYNRALMFAKGIDSPSPTLTLGPVNTYPVISTNNFPDGSWLT